MSTATTPTKAKKLGQSQVRGKLTQKQWKEIHGIMRQINDAWRQHNEELKRIFAKYNP